VDLRQGVFYHYDKAGMDEHIIRVSGETDPIYLYDLISGT